MLGEDAFGMTNEEMVVKLQNGYDGYDEFLEQNMGMIYERAHYFSKRTKVFEYEDLVSIFMFEVYRAVKYYNPNLGIKFTTYAYRFMINTFYNKLKSEELRRQLNSSMSLNQKANIGESDSVEIIDLIVDDSLPHFDDIVYSDEEHIKLTCIKVLRRRKLSEQKIEIIMTALGQRGKLQSFADELGVSRQRTSAIFIEGKKILQEELPKYGVDVWGIDWEVCA